MAKPLALVLLLVTLSIVAAHCASADEPVEDRIRAAWKLGLPLIDKAAASYPSHRKCFSCHHQTLPMLAVICAEHAGIARNDELLKAQSEFTHASFTKQLEMLREGKGIGGRALTVSYGLWTLGLAKWPADETTGAMVTYLLKTQEDDGRWTLHAHRPPMEESLATCMVLSVAGMKRYATAEQKEAFEAACAKAKTFLIGLTPESQEDRVSRLWGLHELHGEADAIGAARQAVLDAQRADGGWSQLAEMESDAYATGQTLLVLRLTGTPPTEPACHRGVEFLLKTQRPDGSWLVETRSKPVQLYFDNGDPHGKSQFISTPATCWALAALANACAK